MELLFSFELTLLWEDRYVLEEEVLRVAVYSAKGKIQEEALPEESGEGPRGGDMWAEGLRNRFCKQRET